MENDVMETNTESPPLRPPPKRLQRSRDDRMIAGVAGGLAKHLNIDPVIVRIGFVAATFAGGLGVLIYVVGWLLVPEEGSAESLGGSASEPLKSIPRWILAALVGVAAVAMISDGWVNLGRGEGGFLWAILLIGGGILLYRADTASPKPSSDDGDGEPSAPARDAAITTRMPVTPATPPKPRKERSYLGRYTFAAMLLILGVAAMLDGIGVFTWRAEQYPAFALLIVAGGLLIGTFVGRSRSLILLGLMLMPLALGSTLIRVPLEGGTGARNYTPRNVAEVKDAYRLGVGTLTIDLQELQGDQPVEILATVVAGRLNINVPNNVTVEFDGKVGAGHIFIFNNNRDGMNASLTDTFEGSADSRTVVINAEVSFGEIYVTAHRPNQKGAR